MDSLYLPKLKSENSKRTTFLATYRQQSFSLPVDSIIYYILMNPTSPEAYQKLIQSCKYFFINNPILVTLNFIFNSKNGCHTLINETPFSLNNVGSKFWIVDSITVGNNDSYKACSLSTIISKIYQCDAKKVTFWNQNTRILYKDFIFVSSKCKELHLLNAAIMYEDDSIVTLEKIVEALPKLKILAVGVILLKIS
uniref:Uncharacterized protein n=1 Tax=Panagrolaimus davidi TaxID=227884 RepID=A0A914PVB1_9BILA